MRLVRPWVRALGAILLLQCLPAVGRAQKATPRVAGVAFALAAADSTDPSGQKSEGLAILLSTGSLVVPVGAGALLMSHSAGTGQGGVGAAMIAGGLLLGPSAGYFYGGCSKRALTGIGIRAGVVALTGLVMLATPPTGDFDVDVLIGGACIAVVGLEGLYECFAVGGCVRDHNRANGQMGLWVAPGPGTPSIHAGWRVSY